MNVVFLHLCCSFYLSKSVLPLQVGVHYELSEEEKFYRNALTRMPDGPAALEEAYNAVEDIVTEVEQYVKVRVIYNVLSCLRITSDSIALFEEKI